MIIQIAAWIAGAVALVALIAVIADEYQRFTRQSQIDRQSRIASALNAIRHFFHRPSNRNATQWWIGLGAFWVATAGVLLSGLKIDVLVDRVATNTEFRHSFCHLAPKGSTSTERREAVTTSEVANSTQAHSTPRSLAAVVPSNSAPSPVSSTGDTDGASASTDTTTARTSPTLPAEQSVPAKSNITLPRHDERWHEALDWVSSVMVPLAYLLPLGWLWLFAASWLRSQSDREITSLLYAISAVVVPYCVLALAMVLELQRMIAEGGIHAIGVIASIMILYFLTALGGFLFLEMPEFREKMRLLLEDRLPWYRYFAALSTPAVGEPAPGNRVTALLHSWSRVYNLGTDRADDKFLPSPPMTRRTQFTKVCVGTLLDTYLKEEIADVTGQLDRSHVPAALWPRFYERGEAGRVAFMATNLSYFQALLKELVKKLAVPLERRKFCMAIITNVLPSQWWNWPREDGYWGYYSPVADYRNTLVGVKDYARVFRYVLVAEEGDRPRAASMPLFTKREWDAQKNWYCLVDKDDTLRSAPLVKPTFTDDFLCHDATGKVDADHSYYMGDNTSVTGFRCEAVNHVYHQLMHPHAGWTQVLPVKQERFQAPLNDENLTASGFDNCADLMFLGTCGADVTDAWDKHVDVEWGVVLMSSLSASSKTMFLTTVYDDALIDRIWAGSQAAIENAVREAPQGFPAKVE